MPRPREFNEKDVLQKAMLLFWQKGYHDTSLKDLIANLGISNASIYNTFGGKRQLFDRAFAHYRQVNNQGLTHFLSTQDDVRQALRMMFEKIVYDDCQDAHAKGCFVVNTTTELSADHVICETVQDHQRYIENVFLQLLQKGVQNGQISPEKDIQVMANTLYTLMTGLRVLGKAKQEPAASLATVDTVLRILD